ncbi:MAG: universal stress protein [Nitrospirae bacterium]|nr:universal stress protein [Nitrospirota bacterium]
MEYRIVLCPIDTPEHSHKGIDTAMYLSRISGARLVLLHVVENWYRSQSFTTNSPEWTAIHKEWLDEGRKLLEDAESAVRKSGVNNVETVLAEGDISHEIIAEAKKRRVDLIVMTTERYSGIEKLFIGSVTDRVTRNTPCPVLLINE